jgi:hypothetical protein
MGALCGKESSSDPFSQPGRTVSSAPAPQTNSSVPAQRTVGGPPRTLGGSSNPDSNANEDARKKAAEAAEVSCTPWPNRTLQLGNNFLHLETSSGGEKSHGPIG